jgi:Na+-translocating ferredoxin:NAD+ oxidoreductase subunit B
LIKNPQKDVLIKIFKSKNCGMCGFKKCRQFINALISEKVQIDKCNIISDIEKGVVLKILGKKIDEEKGSFAVIACSGGIECKDKMDYKGINKCLYAQDKFDGNKECKWGCLGFGDCVAACPFYAIALNSETGLPVIDLNKCTGCGECIKSCPKGLIKIIPANFKYYVLCSSHERGQNVKKSCNKGCISCGICMRVCPVKDIVIENNLAVIKYKNCNNCGICFHKCPTKSIRERQILKQEQEKTV